MMQSTQKHGSKNDASRRFIELVNRQLSLPVDQLFDRRVSGLSHKHRKKMFKLPGSGQLKLRSKVRKKMAEAIKGSKSVRDVSMSGDLFEVMHESLIEKAFWVCIIKRFNLYNMVAEQVQMIWEQLKNPPWTLEYFVEMARNPECQALVQASLNQLFLYDEVEGVKKMSLTKELITDATVESIIREHEKQQAYAMFFLINIWFLLQYVSSDEVACLSDSLYIDDVPLSAIDSEKVTGSLEVAVSEWFDTLDETQNIVLTDEQLDVLHDAILFSGQKESVISGLSAVESKDAFVDLMAHLKKSLMTTQTSAPEDVVLVSKQIVIVDHVIKASDHWKKIRERYMNTTVDEKPDQRFSAVSGRARSAADFLEQHLKAELDHRQYLGKVWNKSCFFGSLAKAIRSRSNRLSRDY